MDELNKTLAEWRGLTVALLWGHIEMECGEFDIVPPDLEKQEFDNEQRWCFFDTSIQLPGCEPGLWVLLPDFTSSLDACFKHLVPKLNYIIIFDYAEGGWACFLRGCDGAPDKAIGEAETPALALCKAIEKLIDSEGK